MPNTALSGLGNPDADPPGVPGATPDTRAPRSANPAEHLVTTAAAGPMAMRGVLPGNQANGAVTVTTVRLATGVEQTAPFVRMSADSSDGWHESTTADPAFTY